MRMKLPAVGQVVLRVDVGLADAVLVGHGHQRGHLGDQADRRDLAVLRVVDVGAVVIEGRQRAHQAGHHRHRVRVAAEAAQEELHLLVDHGVVGHELGEVLAAASRWAGRRTAAGSRCRGSRTAGQLLDRVAAVQQFALVAVDVGDGRVARRRGQEARVVGELAGLAVQLADVDHVRADAALVDRQVHARAAVGERQGGFHVGGGHRLGLSNQVGITSGLGGCASQRQHLAHFGSVDLALRLACAPAAGPADRCRPGPSGPQPRGLPCRDRLLVRGRSAR
jgi:hypothetical protein